MTSHPAAPEPEKPENVQCSICLAPPPYGSCAGDEACAYTMLLQRRIDLLLTEIKGHMRVEDELKHDIARHLAICSEQATRIAELEKDAARYRWLRDIGDDSWTPLAKRISAWANDGVPISLHEIEAHIDAALKCRA